MQHSEGGRHPRNAALGGGAPTHGSAPPRPAAAGEDPTELLGGLHGSGGEYEVVGPTDAGAALGSLAGSLIGSLGAGVAGASPGASAAAVTGAAGMGAALGAMLGHRLGGSPRKRGGGGGGGGGGVDDALDGGDVPLLGDEDVAIERASRAAEAAEAAEQRAAAGEAVATRGSEEEAGGAAPGAPELIGLQPLCEMGVNAGMYLGHGHSVAEAE